jgi:hypothetical protein
MDLLIKVACFVIKVDNIVSIKYKLVSTRRSTVVIFPVQYGFPAHSIKMACGIITLSIKTASISILSILVKCNPKHYIFLPLC